jgi:uncharacterized protein (DUF1697 family)
MLSTAVFGRMHTLVSMIRGINVGGNRPLRMDTLKALHEGLGFRKVRTYLQSGNTVFEAPGPDTEGHARSLERRILRECGFEVAVAVRSSSGMTAVLGSNPLLGRPSVDAKFLHATFLVRRPGTPSLAGVDLPLARGEAAVLVGDVVYVYCPLGYGNSRP